MARRRLNKNLVVVLALGAFASMIVLSVIMLRQLRQRDPAYMIEVAGRYEREEAWQTAALFYVKAWERSGDALHLVRRGDMLLNDGNIAGARASWRQAMISRPDLVEAHTRMLELLLELARLYGTSDSWKRVHEAADEFLESGAERTDRQTAFAQNAKGLAFVNLAAHGEKSDEEGEAALRAAVDIAGDVVDYRLDLVAHCIRQARLDEGEQSFSELLAAHSVPGPDAAKVRLAYAQYLAGQRRVEEARQYFKESVSLAESDAAALRDAKLGYAEFLFRQWVGTARSDSEASSAKALMEEVETMLRACIEADPDDYDPYLRLAILYKSAGRHSDAVDLCETRLKRGLSRKGVEAARNRMQAFSLMIYASEACVAEAVAAQQVGDQDQREQWLARAERYVTDARGEASTHPRVLAQAGRIKLARGLDRPGLEDLRAADDGYRSLGTINWDNKMILARLHLKLNEAGAARTLLDEVLEEARRTRGGDVNFWTLYGRVLLQNNEYERALAVADRILLALPDNAEALHLKASAYDRMGRPGEASRMVTDQAVRAILTARERTLDGDDEGAVAVLREALEASPDDPRLVRATVHLLVNLDRAGEARAVTETALAARPDDATLRALAVVVREDQSPEERDEAMLEIIASHEDAYQRAIELVAFYSRKDDRSKALPYMDEALKHLVAKDTPAARNATTAHHRALLQAKLGAAAASGDTEVLAAVRDEAVRFNVDGAGGRSILGLYHMHLKEYELAIMAFREAVEIQPTDARSLTRLGQCLQIVGRTGEARETYERALEVNPNHGEAHWGLAILARVRGDTEAYERELVVCERLIPTDPRVRDAVLARREAADPKTAVARREQQLSKDPNDVPNLRRLAALCETIDDLAKADAYHDRLLELEPDKKDNIVSASKYYRRTGRPEKSLEVVTRYVESRTAPEEKANARILLASHYLDQDHPELVEDTLLAAAELAETYEVAQSLAEFYYRSDRPGESLPWFGKAIERARAEASPRLPAALAFRIRCLLDRRINDIDAARRYVAELLATCPDYTPGLLLESEVHARTGRIDKAIAALSKYLERKPDDFGALYRRALHYRASGRPAAAINDLETIKRYKGLAFDLNPRLLLADLQKQAGRKDLWLRELESLVEDAPTSATAIEELATAYIQEDRLAEAEHMVTAQINRAGERPEARWFFLRGQISLAVGDRERAVADFRRGAEVSAFADESVMRVLDLYLRLGLAAEGIRYYEGHARTEEPTATIIARYARLLATAGRKAEAAEQFRRAMGLATVESSEAIGSVAVDLRAAFSTNEAITDAIALFEGSAPSGAEARANDRILTQLYRMGRQYSLAQTLLERLISTCDAPQERALLFRELGDMHQLAGEPRRAREAYERALEHDDNNWITLNNLAYLLSDQLGEYEPARRYAERAVAIADSPDTLDTLGWIYVGLGQYPLAIAELSAAIRLDPSAALPFYHLGEAYRRNEQFSEAADILNSGRDLAEAGGDTGLVARCDASLERVGRSDTAP